MPLGPVEFTATAQGTNVAFTILADDFTELISIERLIPPGTQLGTGTIVRGTENVPVTSSAWVGNDYEAPGGVAIEYVAIVQGDDAGDRAEVHTVVDGELDYGGDYLMPVGFPNLGFVVNVEYGGMGGLTRDVQRDVIPVLGRSDPVVVSFGRRMWEGSITFLTLDDAEKRSLLIAMQAPVIMFVARPGFGFDEPVFLSPGPVTEGRTVGLGSEQSRRWEIPFLQVARPPAFYGTDIPGVLWQDKLDAAQTWEQVRDSNLIWFDFAGYRAP